MSEETRRLPPQSRDAEQSVLGAGQISTVAARKAQSILNAADFYVPAHPPIFRAMGWLLENGQPCDTLTLMEVLRTRGQLEQVGGLSYLNTLAESVPTAAHVDAYCKTVQEKADLRAWIAFLSEQLNACYDGKADTDRMQAAFVEFILAHKRRPHVLQNASIVALNELERITTGQAEEACLCGIRGIDRLTGGADRGTVNLICGTPGSGKSILGWQQAEYCAQAWGPTIVVSLEMKAIHLVRRAISAKSWLTFRELQSAGQWNEEGRFEQFREAELDRISEAAIAISRFPHPILIDEDTYQLGQLVHRLHLWKAEHKIDAAVIDYGQLLEDDRPAENRTVEMMRISRTLKHAAQALDLVLFVLVQPTQDSGRRSGAKGKRSAGARITMSDILGGRQWNADAQQIILLHPDPDFSGQDGESGVICEVAKNRNGSRGECPLVLDGPHFTFYERADRDDAPPEGRQRW